MAKDITFEVKGSLVIGLAFDAEEEVPTGEDLKKILAEHIVDNIERFGREYVVNMIDTTKIIQTAEI